MRLASHHDALCAVLRIFLPVLAMTSGYFFADDCDLFLCISVKPDNRLLTIILAYSGMWQQWSNNDSEQ
jgi:hypothetical protein